VSASMRVEGDGTDMLRVSVRDSGRGLSDAEKLSCFNAYAKASLESGGGTGLGLFISNAFAKLMGGTLKVESKLGEGATFTLAVPVRILTDEEVAASIAGSRELSAASTAIDVSTGLMPPLRGCKRLLPDAAASAQRYCCLLADDHRLNVMLMSRLLTLNGFEVTTAEDGLQALDALKSGKVFDLAILDMEMPHLTGPEVCVAYRSYEAQRGIVRLPVVSLTANVLQEHADHCFASGMDAFLTKPITAAAILQLRATAKQHAAERGAREAAKGQGSPGAKAGRKQEE
jgi:CheY-like chemotaxis protein